MNQPISETQKNTDLEQLRPPKKYAVCLLNDDFTPMQFVVQILQEVFFLSQDTAETLMWKVHREGKAICGVYSLDIAMTKRTQVEILAHQAEHPLRCIVEESA
ncbi:MAG: ATP-dependent Clp protease adapter ClpS [Neisseria sp.]|nr:ATP-dependent Clp protease adapter ClpS [Neisseria sp.]